MHWMADYFAAHLESENDFWTFSILDIITFAKWMESMYTFNQSAQSLRIHSAHTIEQYKEKWKVLQTSHSASTIQDENKK